MSWRTVAAIVTRVVAELAGRTDRLATLRKIGIDEISYRRGQRYLLVVVDHDTGPMVWAGNGRNAATLATFFDTLGPDRARRLTHVSADGADWILQVVTARAPQAVFCMDSFHVLAWVATGLDAVRRGMWNQLRRAGKTEQATAIKGRRWALLKTHAT